MNHLLKLGTLLVGLVVGGVLAAAQSLPAPLRYTSSDERTQADENVSHRSFKNIAKLFAVFLALLGVLGLLGVASGIVPIKASTGHWPFTHWFLDFAKVRSVSTNSLGVSAPNLDQPWLVLKGAGHYEFGCRPCHGSPDLPQPQIVQKMTPAPPYLPTHVSRWQNEELFYIVKHGIKFTGMPAWPSLQRDDEVWAMVAFLRQFPGLKGDEYRRLVQGEATSSGEVALLPDLVGSEDVRQVLMTSCARCHGLDGLGRGQAAFPKLAGQSLDYLNRSMQAYARAQRHSGMMEPLASGLSEAELYEVSRYYANLPASAAPQSITNATGEHGKVIAQQGLPGQRVPACNACHGSDTTPRNTAYPKLANQYADYLLLQLDLFKQGKRGGTDYAHIMQQIAGGLTAEQMREVADYFAGLAPSNNAVAGARGAGQ
jgi:cytochrome c553